MEISNGFITITTEDWVNWEEEAIWDALHKIKYHVYQMNASKESFSGGWISQKRHMRNCMYHKREIRHWRERYRVLTRKREGLS